MQDEKIQPKPEKKDSQKLSKEDNQHKENTPEWTKPAEQAETKEEEQLDDAKSFLNLPKPIQTPKNLYDDVKREYIVAFDRVKSWLNVESL